MSAKSQPSTRYTDVIELANANEELTVSECKASSNKMLKIASVAYKDSPIRIKLDTWHRIVYEPSVYNGTGDEQRKNIVFEISPEIEHALAALEDTLRQLMEERVSNIDSIWCSAIKPATDFNGPTMKAKIRVSGEQVCKFFDENNMTRETPEVFKALDAKVVLCIQGIYVQKQAAGLLMTVTHMQTRPKELVEDLASPF